MLSTTCHVYFGKMLGATADGRLAGTPISDGTSPSHGADRHGPTAVIHSLGKMDQVKSGGTLLNQRFLPSVLASRRASRSWPSSSAAISAWAATTSSSTSSTPPPCAGPGRPRNYRDLLVRVAGYSDYFVDLDRHHQEEIIITAMPVAH
jgi:trans-4-hydroxy-L-proline dehydratase